MGNYIGRTSTRVEPISIQNDVLFPSKRTIIINQAYCYGCHSRMENQGVCKCGNVEVYGNTDVLGRRVKNDSLYSDCSLVEYK